MALPHLGQCGEKPEYEFPAKAVVVAFCCAYAGDNLAVQRLVV
jgi:hypothetical protein